MRIFLIYFPLALLCLAGRSHQSTTVDSSDAETTSESPKSPLVVKSVDKANGLPKETQMAQCTVTSGDIKASAQATFSKKLEGFCSTQDMNNLNDFLSAIENRLLDEIYNLRNIVQNLMPNNNHQRNNYDSYYDNNNVPRYQQNYYRDQERSYENYDNRRNNPYYGDRNYNRADDYNRRQYNDDYLYKEKKYHEHTEKTTQKYLKKNQTTSTERTFFESSRKAPEIVAFRNNNNMLKSLETPREHIFKVTTVDTSTASPSTTQENIDLPTSAKSEYVYYWKLENFPKVFTVDMKNELFSHVFNVKGLFLRIRAVWNQIDGNFMLDTEHLANVDNADKFEIEVSDGLVFKEIADEQLFQYSFAIMDQSKPNHDLISPIYSNTDSETFTIPNSLILLNNYVKNDSLLIKLIISF